MNALNPAVYAYAEIQGLKADPICVILLFKSNDKSVFAGECSVNNRAGTLLEKSSPRTPPQKPFIAFSPFGDTSPNNEKVARVYKRVRRKIFSEELTQLCTKYSSINSDLPRFAYRATVDILLGVFSLKLFFLNSTTFSG